MQSSTPLAKANHNACSYAVVPTVLCKTEEGLAVYPLKPEWAPIGKLPPPPPCAAPRSFFGSFVDELTTSLPSLDSPPTKPLTSVGPPTFAKAIEAYEDSTEKGNRPSTGEMEPSGEKENVPPCGIENAPSGKKRKFSEMEKEPEEPVPAFWWVYDRQKEVFLGDYHKERDRRAGRGTVRRRGLGTWSFGE